MADSLPAPITKTADAYMALITPWQAASIKARFLATVRAGVQPYADGQAVVASLPSAFDLDYGVGVQLDTDGQWIGRSRLIPTPAPNILFSFDTDNLGFDQGYVDGPYDSSQGLSALSDDDYRRLLNAKVLANSWDGTADGVLAILRAYFTDPATIIFVQDDAQAIPFAPESPPIFAFDVDGHGFDQGYLWDAFLYPGTAPDAATITYTVCFSGKIPSDLNLYVLGGLLIPVNAMAAHVDYAVTTVDGAPVFGFDMENDHVSGFDVGAIDSDPFTVANITP